MARSGQIQQRVTVSLATTVGTVDADF